MDRRSRNLVIGFGAAVAVVAAVALWGYLVFVRGDRRVDRPGGHWAVEFVSYPGSYGGSGDLYFDDRSGRVLVAPVVHSYRYYGDDCLAYSSAADGHERYFFVCGRRRSVPIAPESGTTWEMTPDALRQQGAETTGTAFESGQAVVKIPDLKRLAFRQPAI